MKIDYAVMLQLTQEEMERIGNGKGGFVIRDGKMVAVLGDRVKIGSVHQIKEWK